MTASLGNFQNGPFGSNLDNFVYPQFINARRAPTANDIFNPGTRWQDSSVNPPVIYQTSGYGTWIVDTNVPATTSTYGTVLLTDNSEPVATKAYADALVTAGAPVATETTSGIGKLVSDADAVAEIPSTPVQAYFLQPSNLSAVFAAPPAGGIGTTTPRPVVATDLTADGTLDLDTTVAGHILVTGTDDFSIGSTAGSINISAGEAAADAISIQAAAGGLDVDTALLLSLRSSRNSASAIEIVASAGGVDISATGTAGEDIDIVATGSSVNISGTENIADAVTISAANGGIDITCGGAAGEDIDIVNTAGSINISAGEGVSDAINVDSSGGIDVDALGAINIASAANGASAVVVTASAGGVDITATGAAAGEDINITATGSSVNVTSTENAALAVYLHADGGTSETIRLRSDQGTGVASIDVLSDVGGVTITAGLNTADAINIVTSNAAGGIDIDSGTNGFIVDTTGAISLDAAAASNFTATGAFDVTVSSTAGSINISGGEAAADAINIDAAAGGLDVDVVLQMNLDSSQAAATAVRIIASDAAGGMDVDAGTGGIAIDTTGALSLDSAATSNYTVTGAGADLNLMSVGGSVLVDSTENAALAIRLHANGGTSETIQVHADQGTGVSSIGLLSDAGGITLRSTGMASADAINLEAAAGGVDIDGALEINITSSQAAATALNLIASAGTGGITMAAGSGGVNITGATVVTGALTTSGDLTLSSVATKISMNGGAVTDFIGRATLVAGTVTVANTNIDAGDRIFVTRSALNGSPALGFPITTISAGASFTIASYSAVGAAVATDVSTFDYVIVRQT